MALCSSATAEEQASASSGLGTVCALTARGAPEGAVAPCMPTGALLHSDLRNAAAFPGAVAPCASTGAVAPPGT
eukprot:15607030-Heterocapsa_arctica.AAC.1